MKRTALHLSKRPADVDWMLDVIATLDENHEYFAKDYVKPKKQVDSAEMVHQSNLIHNNNGFFDSLPLSKNVSKKHKLNLLGQTKVEREKQKLVKMQRQFEKLQEKMQTQAVQIEQLANENDSDDE